MIALLDSLDKLMEKTAAHLIANQLERGRKVHEGLYGYRRRPPCIDAVAVLISDTHRAWSRKRIAGVLLMDVKSAFNSVSQSIACYSWKWKTTSQMDGERAGKPDYRKERTMKSAPEIPQGSPASSPRQYPMYTMPCGWWKTSMKNPQRQSGGSGKSSPGIDRRGCGNI